MKRKKYLLFYGVFLLIMVLLFSMCGDGGSPTPPGVITETTTETLTGGETVTVQSPVKVTIEEITDPSSYPPGPKTGVVNIQGTLSSGQTAEIAFKSAGGFGTSDRVAYLDAGGHWSPLPSTLSPDGKSIKTTTTHFSFWTVIEVSAGDFVDISGDVIIALGDDWADAFSLTEKYLYVMLIDDETEDVERMLDPILIGDVTYDAEDETYTAPYIFEEVGEGIYTVAVVIDMVIGDEFPSEDDPQSV
ncbi:hypothetical protein KA005_78320, partial [bacterium]|nr:hypothetical protein [bacterium]